MKATAKDLRFHTKSLMDAVSRGEEVIITFRGKPCAKLIACTEGNPKSEKSALFGLWADHAAEQSVEEQVRALRKGRFP